MYKVGHVFKEGELPEALNLNKLKIGTKFSCVKSYNTRVYQIGDIKEVIKGNNPWGSLELAGNYNGCSAEWIIEYIPTSEEDYDFQPGDYVEVVGNTHHGIHEVGFKGYISKYRSSFHYKVEKTFGVSESGNNYHKKDLKLIRKANEKGEDKLECINSSEAARIRQTIFKMRGGEDWSNVRRTYGFNSSAIQSKASTLAVALHIGVDISKALRREFEAGFISQNDRNLVSMECVNLGIPDVFSADKKEKKVSGGKIKDAEALVELMGSIIGVDESEVKAIVKGEVKPLSERINALESRDTKAIVIKDNKELGELPEIRHPQAELLLKALSAQTTDGNYLNVWIAGPAGSGKTFAVKQVAKALGIDYGFHGAMTMAHELVGFVDANGTYHETQFVKLYRNGGVCLLDEVDAGSSEALLALNAALANGEMSLPNGEIIQRHKDFRCVGAANTFGHGATAEYVGRARIDAAFLDRFGVRLSWGYDERLEQDICGDIKWARYVQEARKKAASKGLKVLITPRASMAGAPLVAGGMSFREVAEITFLSGMTDEQKRMIMPT